MTRVKNKKRWADLTPAQQKAVILGGAVELVLTAAALRDLAGRPASEVRGAKWVWVLSFVVQPFGPLVYFARGRRTAD